jgi:hypothetical protein
MTTPSGPEAYTGPLSELFDKVEGEVQKIIDKYNSAVHHINDWKYVLGPALIWISDALQKVREGLDKVVKLVQHAAEHHTPVVSLIDQSFNWQDHVHPAARWHVAAGGQPVTPETQS